MSDVKVVLPTTTEEWQRDMDIAYQKGRADGYSQAENDYHKQTEKDRQVAYDCGYEQGIVDNYEKIRADMLDKIIRAMKDRYHCVEDLCDESLDCTECVVRYLERLKEQMSDGTNDN